MCNGGGNGYKIKGPLKESIQSAVEKSNESNYRQKIVLELESALQKLNPLDRFLILVRMEGLTLQEIANVWISDKKLDKIDRTLSNVNDEIEEDKLLDKKFSRLKDLPSVSAEYIRIKEKKIVQILREIINADTNT